MWNKVWKVPFFNSLARLIRTQKQVKVASPEESGPIVAHENVHFSFENQAKQGVQSLLMKMRIIKLYLKVATVNIYGFHLLATRLPELASKLERLDCSHLFNSEHRSKLSTDFSSGELIRNCWGSLRWDERRSLLSELAFLHCIYVCCCNNKASLHKQKQFN